MTALSGSADEHQRNFKGLSCLARTSLVLPGVMALGSAGCLVTESPDFHAPQLVGPFLTNLSPSPATAQVIAYEPGSTKIYRRNSQIDFDIVSEDLGQPLTAFVVLDFKALTNPDFKVLCPFYDIPPGTLQSKRDLFTCKIDLNAISPQVTRGCHTIAVVVSHNFRALSLQPVKEGDVAVATWFYQVGTDESAPPETFPACVPDQTSLDAGTDARVDGGGL